MKAPITPNMAYGISPRINNFKLPSLLTKLPINGANITTPKEGMVISQLGENAKFKCLTIPDREGAIAVPTIIVKELTRSSVKIPDFDISFMLQKSN